MGGDGSAISGRRGLVPFDLNYKGVKTATGTSVTVIFCRLDQLVFIRPDLVVQVLGL